MTAYIRYAGSKEHLFAEIEAAFPQHVHSYYEPFLGGASVLLHLLQLVEAGKVSIGGEIVVGDVNPFLMQLHRDVSERCGELQDAYASVWHGFLEEVTDEELPCTATTGLKAYWLDVRARYNILQETGVPTVVTSAHLLFLQNTAYMGLHRENNSGGYNGTLTHARIADVLRIIDSSVDAVDRASALYNKYGVRFETSAFSEFCVRYLADTQSDDLVFLDPPYDGGWQAYTAGGFLEQDAVMAWFTNVQLQCVAFMTNYDTPAVRAATEGMSVKRMQEGRRKVELWIGGLPDVTV